MFYAIGCELVPCLVGLMFYAIGRELLSSQSPSGVYGKALKLCRKSYEVKLD